MLGRKAHLHTHKTTYCEHGGVNVCDWTLWQQNIVQCAMAIAHIREVQQLSLPVNTFSARQETLPGSMSPAYTYAGGCTLSRFDTVHWTAPDVCMQGLAGKALCPFAHFYYVVCTCSL